MITVSRSSFKDSKEQLLPTLTFSDNLEALAYLATEEVVRDCSITEVLPGRISTTTKIINRFETSTIVGPSEQMLPLVNFVRGFQAMGLDCAGHLPLVAQLTMDEANRSLGNSPNKITADDELKAAVPKIFRMFQIKLALMIALEGDNLQDIDVDIGLESTIEEYINAFRQAQIHPD